MELVESGARSGGAPYIGLGLIGSLIIGFDPLRDAFQGNGTFESAMFRFLACVGVCVFGASVVGRLLDSAAEPDSDHDADPADEADAGLDGDHGSGDAAPAGRG